MTIDYFDPETFEKTTHEFDEYHYELLQSFRELLSSKTIVITQPLSDKEGKLLMFGVIRERRDDEIIAEKYKITIEKISDAS